MNITQERRQKPLNWPADFPNKHDPEARLASEIRELEVIGDLGKFVADRDVQSRPSI